MALGTYRQDLSGSSSFGVDLKYTGVKTTANDEGSKSIHQVLADIGIQIQSVIQANRIDGEVAAGAWITTPVPIVMQTSFGVKVLARETEVVGDDVACLDWASPKGR